LPLLNNTIFRNLFAVFLLFGQGFFCSAQTKEYTITAEKSRVSFKISHMGLLTVNGKFDDFSGKLIFKSEKLMSITSDIIVESINTKDKNRDKILKSKAYLDADRYPLITFRSNNVSKDSITGILKMNNVEKKISMPLEIIKAGREISIKIITTLLRKEFKLDFGAMDALVGDEVKIELEIISY
jgi:polyisoprenoid-binding protein YceI